MNNDGFMYILLTAGGFVYIATGSIWAIVVTLAIIFVWAYHK